MSQMESMPWAPYAVKKQNISQDFASELQGVPCHPQPPFKDSI